MRRLLVGPAVCSLKQGAQVIDLPCMIEIMGDHNAYDIPWGQSFAPVREPLAIQFAIVRKRANGSKPSSVSVREPGKKLITGTRARPPPE